MLKFHLLDDNAPIWIAPSHVVQLFPNENGTTIHLTGQIQSHVREAPEEVALLIGTRAR